jgi:2-dehydro-3-deoxygalactonokinase
MRPSQSVSPSCAIALDGGTTNTRARLLRGRQVAVTARRQIGVKDNLATGSSESARTGPEAAQASQAPHGHRSRLAEAVREVIDEVLGPSRKPAAPSGDDTLHPEFIVAAGMLSSEVGLLTVPHVSAPAGLEDVASALVMARLPGISALPFYFVPGIRTAESDGRDGWFQADVMRGEECETWGAYAELTSAGAIEPGRWLAFLWPGSHTKLIEVDGAGRIIRSHTSLAGELLDTVARHTLLAASLTSALPDHIDHDAAAAGARAVAGNGLGRAAFLVRIAQLTQNLDVFERASFWIGAVVESDVECLARHSILAPGRPVWVGGRQPLRSLYATWLGRRHSGTVTPVDDALADAASALGAIDIACRLTRG